MRAAVLKQFGEPLEIEDIERPEVTKDGVVVETDACGICRSDWHVWQGEWSWLGIDIGQGQVLGHEPAGVVVEVGGDVETVSEGDRIAIPFNLADGTCPKCLNGHSNVCENGEGLGFSPDVPGAFAEEVHVPRADYNVVHLPDGVSAVDMAGLGCRFTTAFHALAHRADIAPGDWVAIHGCGGIGLSAVHIANALGANVVAVDIMPEKLDKVRELGADEVVNAADTDDVPGAIQSLTNGGAAVSMDALGSPETVRNSVLSLDSLGQHLQVGLTSEKEKGMVSVPSDVISMQEIEFIGSKGMQPPRYGEIFRMVERGKLDPGRVVSKTVSLDELPAELAAMSNYETTGMSVVNEF